MMGCKASVKIKTEILCLIIKISEFDRKSTGDNVDYPVVDLIHKVEFHSVDKIRLEIRNQSTMWTKYLF